MRIIDLLNKIANGEEVPDTIKFNDIIYRKADIGKDYYNFATSEWFFKDIFDASGVNLEVEILEEKKIPEKLYGEPRHIYNENELYIVGKVNEIIDYLSYLKSKGE